MKKKLTAAILAIFIMLTGSLAWATDGVQTDQQAGATTEEEIVYDFELTADNQEGSRVVNLEWEKVDDPTTLLDVANVGDYVNYPITYNEVYSSLNNLGARPASNMQWRVLSKDGTTIKLISTAPVATVNIARGQNYSGITDNPYGYGAADGDSGGYGYYHKIQAIAKCFAKAGYAVSARSVDIADLRRSSELNNLKEHLGETETDNIAIELREYGYTEIHDTDKHGGGLFSSGERIYNRRVARISDANSLYVGGKFFLPNYYNGNNGLNSVYYVNGTNVYLQRLYPYGEAITTGVKVVVTLDTNLYRISGNGSSTTPWEISTTPTHAPYTVYQKQEGGQWVAKGEPSRVPSRQLTSVDGLQDYGTPYKPNAVIDTIKGDDWNIKLTVFAGDTGTEYYHQVKADAKGTKTSNETCVTIMTGVKGYSYVIDTEPDTIPDDEIEFEEGESIKITRLKVNTNPRHIIHIKAIDYSGNVSETLHLELRAKFREIPLHQIYQAAGDYNEYGIAQTPGDNSITVEWGAMDEGEDGPEIEYHIPDICLVVDRSGSMSGNKIRAVRAGINGMVDKILVKYPEMKISIVAFNSSAYTVIANSSNIAQIQSGVNGIPASGGTAIGRGVQLGTSILANSSNTDKMLIVFTDGWNGSGPHPNSTINQAKQNGIKTVAVYTRDANKSELSNCDIKEQVGDDYNALYEAFVEKVFNNIEQMIVPKYNVYREEAGKDTFDKVHELTPDLTFKDKSGTDKAAPTRPIVSLTQDTAGSGDLKLSIWSDDIGTTYEMYVTYVNSKTKEELPSNTVTAEIKTGVAGYSWTITTSKDTNVDNQIDALPKMISKDHSGKWLNIRAVDYAGNASEICHIRIETHRFITWEDLNETKELFCVQHGVTIPARDKENYLNALIVAGSGEYKIREVVTDPKTGDRVGTRFVEGTLTNIYGTQDIWTYSLGKYVVSPSTPKQKPGRKGNATDMEAYILNHYKENGSLESAVQNAMYHTEVSRENEGISWDWETTPESEQLLAEASMYAAMQKRAYKFSSIEQNSGVYMDENYQDILVGPFILDYEPLGTKHGNDVNYLARIIGMKVYNQNNEVISELDINAKNIGNINAEIVYVDEELPNKREEIIFSRENYKFPVGYETFYVKLKYEPDLENVTEINKIEFIHNKYTVDAQYEVLEGTYNKVRWRPNKVNEGTVLWCYETEHGFETCVHDRTESHLIGCYFWLEATVYQSPRYYGIKSQKLINVLWTDSSIDTMVQVLEPNTRESGSGDETGQNANKKWKLVLDVTGNVWEDGLEDKNDGIKENRELGIEKVQVNIYQVDKNMKRTGLSYTTYTDGVGNYEIKAAKKGIYDVEFIYNGQKYVSTKLLVNGNANDYNHNYTLSKYKNNSVAEEVKDKRTEFNNTFEEIAGNKTAIGNGKTTNLSYTEDIKASYIQTADENGYTKDDFKMKVLTSTKQIYYPISDEIFADGKRYIEIVDSENVNLGLAERYTTDTSLRSDLYEVIFSMKGEKQSYIFSEKNIRDKNSSRENEERYSYELEVNRADYNWKLEDLLNKATDDDTKIRILESLMGKANTENKTLEQLRVEVKEQSELEAYLDYIIVIRTHGEKDKVQIAELANYYTKDLVFDFDGNYRDFEMNSWVQVKYDDVTEGENQNKTDKIRVEWKTNSKYGVDNPYSEQYNKMYTNSLDREDLRIQKGEYLELHIVFKVAKDAEDKIELDETNMAKASMTEINGYKTYYIQDGSIAGLIDIDSQPGNANPIETVNNNEDDENKSPSLKLKLEAATHTGDSIDGKDENGEDTNEINPDSINRDENGNIIGFGNVIEGNVWEDSRYKDFIGEENTLTLNNNQVISDGIRQEKEQLIQKVKVNLIEYFKHPTDSAKDVELVVGTQETRTVLSLSNGQKLEGGYSFINLPSGVYYTDFVYGDTEQLLAETQEGYTGKVHTGVDFQGIATEDINKYEERKKTYEDIEIMLVADISGSMNGESNTQIKEKATTIVNGISSRLPRVNIGLVRFNNTAEVISKPQENTNNILKAIQNLGSDNETAIGYGIETAANSYSAAAKVKIMIVLTDSEETVQNVEQVIKTIEIATDERNIELISILTKNNYDIFGKPETVDGKAEPRRGEVYSVYNFSDEVLNSVYEKIVDLSQTEHLRSSARDAQEERAALIEKYKEMGLKEVEASDVSRLKLLTGDAKTQAAIEYAAANKMTAQSKTITFRANNVKNHQVHEINLALMERPLTKLEIESEIVSIKVILPDNTVLIDTAKGISKNVNGLDAAANLEKQNNSDKKPERRELPPITIYMDEEIMHGSTLIVEYKVKLTNKGEIDRLSNYLADGSTGTVTTSASLVLNYTSKNMLYRDENTEAENTVTWDNVEVNDVDDMIVHEAEKSIKENELNVYKSTGFAVELYPEDSVEVQNGTGKSSAEFRITLSKIITAQNDKADLTFDSSLEIVRRANTAGRPSYTERPGNFVPNITLEVDENIELDSIKERKIIITKPWGANSSTQYIIIALAALTATAGGILLLKQKQKKKEE